MHWRRNRGRGARGGSPHSEKRGPAPFLPPPPLFMVHLSLCLALSISVCQLPYLRQHCLCLSMCQRSLQVLENEKFSTPCEGETPPTPSPTRSLRSLVCVPPPPTFKYVATPMICSPSLRLEK